MLRVAETILKKISELQDQIEILEHTARMSYLEGFKKGIDSKSCCCNQCTRHSIAVEEQVENDLFNKDEL